jgi:hypothetical protein
MNKMTRQKLGGHKIIKIHDSTHQRMLEKKGEDETIDSLMNRKMGYKISPLCMIGKHEKCVDEDKGTSKCECGCHNKIKSTKKKGGESK